MDPNFVTQSHKAQWNVHYRLHIAAHLFSIFKSRKLAVHLENRVGLGEILYHKLLGGMLEVG